jgi:hypothetical protein
MSERQLPVSLTAFGSTPRPATASIVEQTPGQRLLRALAGAGMFWAMALAGLFIPIAHFILVPTFFAAGIVMGIKRLREDRRLLGVHGACPRCGLEQTFRVGGRFFDGRAFDCPRCHSALRLTTNSASQAAA